MSLTTPSRYGFAALVFLAWALLFATASAADGENVNVVYHLNEGLEQATNAIRNIGNHLSADPRAKITVVAHAAGINFLLDGRKRQER